MKDRILEFLKAENKSSAMLAEEIGVQPSGISHILSGRNNPSLDFVMKMLDKYQFLSVEWLLFGKGNMYKNQQMKSLFDDNYEENKGYNVKLPVNDLIMPVTDKQESHTERSVTGSSSAESGKKPAVSKIVWFYDDKNFDVYYPNVK